MKLLLNGGNISFPVKNNKCSLKNVEEILDEVGKGIHSKVKNGSELAPMVDGFVIKNVEMEIMFKVKGSDELHHLTVHHHTDQPELLTVIVDIDENGKIAGTTDNQEESLFTEAQAILVDGVPKEFETIESKYTFEEQELVKKTDIGDFTVAVYQRESDIGCAYVQYFKKGNLVQEAKATLSEENTLEKLLEMYT